MDRGVVGSDEGTQGAANQVQVLQIHGSNKLWRKTEKKVNHKVVLKVEDEITINMCSNSSYRQYAMYFIGIVPGDSTSNVNP